MKNILTMAKGDLRNITRDPTLLFFIFIPFIILSIVKWGLPLTFNYILTRWGLNLKAYYIFICGFFILLPPMFYGMIIGFIILDERDGDLLTYFSITPLGKKGYLLNKTIAAALYSFCFSIIFIYFTSPIKINLLKIIIVSLMASLETPLLALFMVAFASNKVEALAISKAFGVLYLSPFIGFFLETKLKFIAGIFPPFWVSMTYWVSSPNFLTFLGYFILGMIVHLIYIFYLLKRFSHQIG